MTQNEQALQAYQIGQVIQVENYQSHAEQAPVINFTADERGQLDGVSVRLADGSLMSIEAKYLELDGSGM